MSTRAIPQRDGATDTPRQGHRGCIARFRKCRMECRKERCTSAHLGTGKVSGEPQGRMLHLGLLHTPDRGAEPREEPAQSVEDL